VADGLGLSPIPHALSFLMLRPRSQGQRGQEVVACSFAHLRSLWGEVLPPETGGCSHLHLYLHLLLPLLMCVLARM